MAKVRTSVGRGKAGKAVVGPGPVDVARPAYFGDGPDGNDPGRPAEEALGLVTDAMRRVWADEEAQTVRSLLEPCPLVVRTPPPVEAGSLTQGLATDLKGKLGAASQARRQDPPHLMVTALAGTGKTTTLVQGARAIRGLDPTVLVGPDGSERVIEPSPQQRAIWAAMAEGHEGVASLCFCAFNKSIATELQRRVPAGCDAMTLHSMGYKAVNRAFGYCRVDDRRVARIVEELTGKDLRELVRTEPGLLGAVEKLVGLAKMNLVPLNTDDPESQARTDELLGELVAHYDIDLEGVSRRRLFELVPQVVEKCRDMRGRALDFNDMIWLPVALGLPLFKYDVLMIDEAQDLNRCQQALTKMAGRRLIYCGDSHQSIYGFAGADARSMARLEEELGTTPRGVVTLPLTVTRRCGRVIVAEAQRYVPEFEAHPDNGLGAVSTARYDHTPTADSPSVGAPWYFEQAAGGDFVLCRVNAPLVSQCFRFLAAGRKATIQGRDIGEGIARTIRSLKATSAADLVARLDEWLEKERAKELAKKFPSDARVIALEDKAACIRVFAEGCDTVEEVLTRVASVFTDNPHQPGIRLSSIHKAKGLEARRVFFLRPKGAGCPHPMAKTPWQQEQERNLCYVATTRAIEELVWVS
jgi:DNA helicase-2/ATP-dependent DNA helicase PcrA